MRISVVIGVAMLALGLSAGCSAEPGTPRPVATTVTPPVTPPTSSVDQNPVQRNQRIRQRLLELGCTTNSCIQTYFACMDGYLTGDPCEFYRQHPPG
ncbi:hypothetical protein [Nocardia sp. NPDC005366]|uniref:hypothetical protein n=1 Tax=Nocardia sp. NPDC005366 TaxID=3156878 RepID=UPI0033BDB36D